MTTLWRSLEAVAVVAGVCLGGYAGAMGAAWVLSRIARRFGTDETPMGSIEQRFTGHDDSLRIESARRRVDADKKKREAAQIASGTKPEEESRIRLVG